MLSATRPIHSRSVRRAERGFFLGSILRHIAANVRRLLAEKDLSQTDLAGAVGVTEPVVSRWLNAKSQIELKHIDKIADYLGVSYEDLVRPPDLSLKTGISNRDLDAILRELAAMRGFELKPKKPRS